MLQEHVTITPTNGSAVLSSHDQQTALPLEGTLVTWYWRISYIYTFWYNFFVNFSRPEHQLDVLYVSFGQLLRFSGFRPKPHFIFPFQSLYDPWYSHIKVIYTGGEYVQENMDWRRQYTCASSRDWSVILSIWSSSTLMSEYRDPTSP